MVGWCLCDFFLPHPEKIFTDFCHIFLYDDTLSHYFQSISWNKIKIQNRYIFQMFLRQLLTYIHRHTYVFTHKSQKYTKGSKFISFEWKESEAKKKSLITFIGIACFWFVPITYVCLCVYVLSWKKICANF